MHERKPSYSMPSRSLAAAIAALALAMLTGCASKDEHRYLSTIGSPKTIELVQPHSRGVLWRYDIPVGHELLVKLDRDDAPQDGVHWLREISPDRIRWWLYPGTYRQSQSAVDEGSMPITADKVLLRMVIRDSPEYPEGYVPQDTIYVHPDEVGGLRDEERKYPPAAKPYAKHPGNYHEGKAPAEGNTGTSGAAPDAMKADAPGDKDGKASKPGDATSDDADSEGAMQSPKGDSKTSEKTDEAGIIGDVLDE